MSRPQRSTSTSQPSMSAVAMVAKCPSPRCSRSSGGGLPEPPDRVFGRRQRSVGRGQDPARAVQSARRPAEQVRGRRHLGVQPAEQAAQRADRPGLPDPQGFGGRRSAPRPRGSPGRPWRGRSRRTRPRRPPRSPRPAGRPGPRNTLARTRAARPPRTPNAPREQSRSPHGPARTASTSNGQRQDQSQSRRCIPHACGGRTAAAMQAFPGGTARLLRQPRKEDPEIALSDRGAVACGGLAALTVARLRTSRLLPRRTAGARPPAGSRPPPSHPGPLIAHRRAPRRAR